MNDSIDLVSEIVRRGIVETHFHVGPELLPRRYDVAELARAARPWNATMVLKNHTYATTPLAAYARKHEEVTLLGGVVLNRFVGGLNPDAIASAASGNRADVRGPADTPPFVVWMPTVHAASHLRCLGHAFDPRWSGGCSSCGCAGKTDAVRKEDAVVVFDAAGKPAPGLIRVLESIAAHGARLATGHLHADEVVRLVPLALEVGVPAVILTHPHYPSIDLDDGQLAALASDERVFIEHCFAIHTIEEVPLERFVQSIAATGAEQVILSTDFGQVHSDPFPEGTFRFAHALDRLRRERFSERQLVRMFTDTPRRALGLARPAAACTAPERRDRTGVPS